jgi:nicotinate-nucleotide pyrophosphorylase (carboxylating)
MQSIDKFLLSAIQEDLGTGDITTNSVIPIEARANGKYIAKEDGILCGIGFAERVYSLLGSDYIFIKHKKDGDKVTKGEIIAEVSGLASLLLSGERIGLNIMQRLSGVATRTREAVDAVSGTNAKITDTRKTTPGMRVLEKYAVKIGGGVNHRFSLADGILIKDNHIIAAGSITAAVNCARASAPHTLKIEVETEELEQVKEALDAGADIIMLDNMTNDMMKDAVELIGGRAITEASGNMGEKTLKDVAACGVDHISIGALTHSVKALDISLKFKLTSES